MIQRPSFASQLDDPEAARSLMADFSIEITPHEARHVRSFADHVPLRTRVYVPFLRNVAFIETVVACAKLRRQGMLPVAHLASRAIRDEAHLHEMLSRLRGEADVEEVLVVGGDVPRPTGRFRCALQLVETGLLERHGVSRIGFGGHPERHPDVGRSVLEEAARAKAAYARRSAASFHWLTQLCFAPARLLEWIRFSRSFPHRLPVHAGIHGPASRRILRRYARLCGVRLSLRAPTRDRGHWPSPWQLQAADLMLSRLSAARQAMPESAPDRLHLYSLGSFVGTAAWACEVLDRVERPAPTAMAPRALRSGGAESPRI